MEPRIALIGLGHWGQNHLRTWAKLGLSVACDTSCERLKDTKARCPDLEVSSQPEEVMGRRDVDAIVIATPAPTHYPIAARALAAGKDVLVEKPMALTPAEGEALQALAERHGRILMVGHVLHYHPAVAKLVELVRTGELGRLQYVYSNRLNFGRIRTEENSLWSFAPHDVAIILRLVGGEPTSVACHGGAYLSAGVADATMTTLAFDAGVRAHIHVSWLHPFKEQRFVVVGERQMAVFDDTLPHEQKLVLYPHRVDWRDGRVPVAQKAEGVAVELSRVEPLAAECEAFLAAIRTRVPPYADGAEGVRVLRVLAAAQTSLERSGAPQSISLAAPPSYFVHPSAVVDDGAEIGEGTKVWHFSHISARTKIGSKCVFGQNVFIAPNVKIGHGVKVQNNVSIYDGVEIEDDVFCGPSMVFTNVMNPRADIERKSEFRRTLIKRGASIGANATIVCGHTVGTHAFVAAGAVVSKDVPDFALVRGVPAVVTGYVCRCAEKLSFSESHEARCGACGREYTRRGDVVKERTRP